MIADAPTPAVVVQSTAYCLNGRMADGTWTRDGSVASNRHRLGTRIRLTKPFRGRKRFVVRDRIGWGTELDLWTPSCSHARWYGRRTARYRVVSGG